MLTKRTYLRRSSYAVLLVLLLALILPVTASAQGIVYGDSIPAGTVLNDDIILAGDRIVIDGDVNGDVLAVGRSVLVNGDITGSLVVAGQEVGLNGNVGGSVYSLALLFDASPEAQVGRSLYFAGISLVLQQGSSIERDLNVASLGAQISADIGRDLHAIIGPLEFIQLIVEALGGEFNLSTSWLPTESISTSKIQTMGVPPLFSISFGKGTQNLEQEADLALQAESQIDWDSVLAWLEGRGRELIPILLVGLLMIWLFPTFLSEAPMKLIEKPWHTLGYGLLALVLALNAVAILILIGLLILVIGLWLGIVSVWDLAFVFWGLGIAAVVLAFSAFALFVLYSTKVIVAYLTGFAILKPIAPQANEHKIVPFMIGLLIYILVVSIPILGFALRIIVTGIGLGVAWVYLLDRRETAPKKTTRAKS